MLCLMSFIASFKFKGNLSVTIEQTRRCLRGTVMSGNVDTILGIEVVRFIAEQTIAFQDDL